MAITNEPTGALDVPEFREMLQGFVGTHGRENGGLVVSQNGTPSMHVQITSGRCYTAGSTSSAQTWWLRSTATETRAISAAAASTRIDRVVASGEAGTITVVDGTPGSGVAPALSAGQISLATVSVAPGTTAITNAMITVTPAGLMMRIAPGQLPGGELVAGSVASAALATGAVTPAKLAAASASTPWPLGPAATVYESLGTFGAGPTTVIQVTATLFANRRVRLSAGLTVQSITPDGLHVQADIKEGGTVVAAIMDHEFAAIGDIHIGHNEAYWGVGSVASLPAGSHTWDLVVTSDSASPSYYVSASANKRTYIAVEDLGPA